MTPEERRAEVARRDPAKVRASDRRRYQRDPERRRRWAREHPERVEELRQESRARYPEKQRARWKVNKALRSGKLVRQPCEVCGAESTQAHHEDYLKPLDVRWLCSVHHGETHRVEAA